MFNLHDIQVNGVWRVPDRLDGTAPVADVRMRQNITELDSLLDDLHTAQKTGFADSKTLTSLVFVRLLFTKPAGSWDLCFIAANPLSWQKLLYIFYSVGKFINFY